jgi:hypothetical protein
MVPHPFSRTCLPLPEDLLPDWHDDWLVVERESHRQKRLHAPERSSAELRAAGTLDGAR